MPETAHPKFAAILEELIRHKVDFIVVGGVAAVLDGAPVNTFDLDIVHSRLPENVTRLLQTLDSLDAEYRTHGRELRPQLSHLSSPGHQLLMTRLGPLDVLGTIGRSRDYYALLPHTVKIEVAGGLHLLVLDLETLIAVKEEVGSEKDAATLPILRHTLKQSRRPPP